jgi:hypothetical protein
VSHLPKTSEKQRFNNQLVQKRTRLCPLLSLDFVDGFFNLLVACVAFGEVSRNSIERLYGPMRGLQTHSNHQNQLSFVRGSGTSQPTGDILHEINCLSASVCPASVLSVLSKANKNAKDAHQQHTYASRLETYKCALNRYFRCVPELGFYKAQ